MSDDEYPREDAEFPPEAPFDEGWKTDQVIMMVVFVLIVAAIALAVVASVLFNR